MAAGLPHILRIIKECLRETLSKLTLMHSSRFYDPFPELSRHFTSPTATLSATLSYSVVASYNY